MKIGIIGCGWLGIKIADFLKSEHELYVTTTSQEKVETFINLGLHPLVVNFSDNAIDEAQSPWDMISALDVLIISMPFSKEAPIDHLKNSLNNLCAFIGPFEKQIFLMSSIGIYPQIETEITESSCTEKDLNPNIFYVENFMRVRYPQMNILRLGGLMGDNRVFSQYKISEPKQLVNHIHYQDICHIIKIMVDQNLAEKTYNVVAPEHPTKAEIIYFQTKNKDYKITEKPFGRKILSDKLQTELNYHFIKPNPVAFDLD